MKRATIALLLAAMAATGNAARADAPVNVRVAETPANITPWLKNKIQSVSNDQIVVTGYSVNRGQCEVSRPWGDDHPIAYGQFIKAPIQQKCYPLEATVLTNVGKYAFKWDAAVRERGCGYSSQESLVQAVELIQYLVFQSVADGPIHVTDVKINRGHCGVTVPNGTIMGFGG